MSLWGERRYVTCTSCDTTVANFKKQTPDPRALALVYSSKDLGTIHLDVIDAATLKAKPVIVSVILKDGRIILLQVSLAPTKEVADHRLVFVPI